MAKAQTEASSNSQLTHTARMQSLPLALSAEDLPTVHHAPDPDRQYTLSPATDHVSQQHRSREHSAP